MFFSLLLTFLFCFFLNMEVHTCKRLSNYHIVSHWSKWGITQIARELTSFSYCPASMRESLLKGLLHTITLEMIKSEIANYECA